MPQTCDALVVGAGPAGASAALHLARRGMRVTLVDRAAFPRAKPCGDALMPGAVEWLRTAGIESVGASGCAFNGVRMVIADRASHEYRFGAAVARGITIRRAEFDHELVKAAVASGVLLVERSSVLGPLFERGRVVGTRLRQESGAEFDVCAPWTIGADGSRSRLARAANLFPSDREQQGVAVRAYFSGVQDLRDVLEIVLPLEARSGISGQAGYGWVFPLAGGLANIGIGAMPGTAAHPGHGPRRLFDAFVARLRVGDSRFQNMKQLGDLQGAALNCAFDARRVAIDGLLLAGDAAGLVDPFTGEGIQWALESGELAAQVAGDASMSRDAAVDRYRDLLSAHFRERIRFGRRMIEARRFAWRMLDQTFESEVPLAGHFRRAMLDFGLGAGRTQTAAPSGNAQAAREADRFFARVDREIEATLGRGFPLLMRMVREWLSDPSRRPRAMLCWHASRIGNVDEAVHVRGVMGVELAFLGYQAFTNVSRRVRGAEDVDPTRASCRAEGRRAERWTDTLAVLTGDYLLARANRVAAELGSDVCRLFAEAGMQICRQEAVAEQSEARIGAGSSAARSGMSVGTNRILHVLAARVSCRLGHVDPATAAFLEDYAAWVAEEAAGSTDPERLVQLRRVRARTYRIVAPSVRSQIEASLDERLRCFESGANPC